MAQTPGTIDSWTGADGTLRHASIWSGLTWAPLGTLTEDGWRLRTVTGAGRYGYDGWRLAKGIPVPAHFQGTTTFLDGFVGYQFQFGTVTLKPFVGVTLVQHAVVPVDPVSALSGRVIGVKLALDTWTRLGDAGWVNVDGSWTPVHQTTSVKARMGVRIWRDLSLGAEASTLSDVNQEMRRGGAFVRYAWDGGEFSIGGGVSARDWFAMGGTTAQPYAGATLLGRF